jgi:catechol 2,3-dioxygenase-like lactoylglutathione lyase family enzyme
MRHLGVVEIKAFVPAKDFELSKRFYQDIGFTLASSGWGVAYFYVGQSSFLLQDFDAEGHADNVMMHLLVEDVDAWWQHIQDAGVVATYGVRLWDLKTQDWGIRDFKLTDPTGVLWHIGQNVGSPRPAP